MEFSGISRLGQTVLRYEAATDLIDIPPLSPGCRMTVVIPARDEERVIDRAISALALQANPADFEVIVFANNCVDATAERARSIASLHPRLRMHIVEGRLPERVANVGSARRIVMDRAAERFLAAGNPLGIVATTDADTIVANDWTARTFEELQLVDAVAGFVEVHHDDQKAMQPLARKLYARETAFRRVCTELETLIDPRPEDPAPRHGAFVGASIAVTAATYVRSGGMPPVSCLEDREFLFALQRIDARIRYSLAVRAFTSGRRAGRVKGGFGTFLGHLYDQGSRGETFLVEHPSAFLRKLEGRAALRRMWEGSHKQADIAMVINVFGRESVSHVELRNRSIPFGNIYEQITAEASVAPAIYPMVPIDEAITVLEAAAAARNVAFPTRNNTASGAG